VQRATVESSHIPVEPKLIQRMCNGRDEDIHRKSTPVATVAESEMMQPAGRGQPLPESERDFFEPRFGQDFSSVRIHSGDRAAAAAAGVNALAYTRGRDIVFGAGQYRPGTYSGRTLLAHELMHVVQQRGGAVAVPALQRLGANPGCNAAQRRTVHQAIYDARGWINQAVSQLETTPAPAGVLQSLRRNFGPTYGVAVNIPLILRRLRVVYRELSTIPFACSTAADATCTTADPPCGHSGEGSHIATICTNPTLATPGDSTFRAGCVLHESFHAAFSNFTVDQYSGWRGHSERTATYPGAGVDPLLNADSYTTLVMDLS